MSPRGWLRQAAALGDSAAGSAPAECSSQDVPKALSPCCCAQPASGARPRICCAEMLEGSVFCELRKSLEWEGGWLSDGDNLSGTQGISSAGTTGLPVLFVICPQWAQGGFSKVQMRGVSRFSENPLHPRGSLWQVWTVGQLGHCTGPTHLSGRKKMVLP